MSLAAQDFEDLVALLDALSYLGGSMEVDGPADLVYEYLAACQWCNAFVCTCEEMTSWEPGS